ncbi:interferon regulatory factor 2 [Triplophysa rosa]|uniref:Interferon regulatory factor 2 n=1 Tax=Triplophysa rosa TaxID=992332 RepID=A0A9W7TM03_TRIRA|nr:interferon regulatory factor 2 [Triplophysa rosa]
MASSLQQSRSVEETAFTLNSTLSTDISATQFKFNQSNQLCFLFSSLYGSPPVQQPNLNLLKRVRFILRIWPSDLQALLCFLKGCVQIPSLALFALDHLTPFMTYFLFLAQHVHAFLFGQEDEKPLLPLPGMSSFISSDKPNFKITTVREPAPSSSHAPFTSASRWAILNSPFSSVHTPDPEPSGQPPVHENRASVIMKTPDVSKSSVKSC